MNRKLASIQKIIAIEPIPNADNIELARVLGWQCVTQKSNNFKPGDLVCYFEINSQLPLSIPEFSFLRKTDLQLLAQIKTIKLKGKFSQGLILPLKLIKDILDRKGLVIDLVEGTDLTEALNITKWELPEVGQSADTFAEFPSFVSKTDETRIQAIPEVLTKYAGTPMYITEKLDGSSVTAFYTPRDTPGLPSKYYESTNDAFIFGVASRARCIKRSDTDPMWNVIKEQKVEQAMRDLALGLVLQGEIVGPGIQNNKLKLPKHEIRWYNVIAVHTRERLGFSSMLSVLNQLHLPHVPIISYNVPMNWTVDELVARASIKSTINSNVWAEGIVVRPMDTIIDPTLGALSFKVISPEFSLKYDE